MLIEIQCKSFLTGVLSMKNIKKISILMAIFTTGSLSYLVARPNMQSSSHDGAAETKSSKAIAAKTLVGPGGKSGKSGATGMAAMAGMASGENSDDSGGSGSGSGGGSGNPTTPSTPPSTPPAGDTTGQQYAAAPNTGVPTTVTTPTAAAPTTPPATSATPDATATDKDKDEHKDQKNNQEKDQEVATPQDDHNQSAEDQAAILEKIKEINAQDDSMQHALSQSSMDLLFNNFVYFKDFIVQNFSKDKMLSLCIEFINQIYPNEHVKVISMDTSDTSNLSPENRSDQPQEQSQDSNDQQPATPEESTSDQMQQPAEQENEQNDQMPQPPADQEPDQNNDQEESAS